MKDIYLSRRQKEEIQVREEMQKELSMMKLYNSDNKRCIALTQKYERMKIDPVLINVFKELYK